jgi:hypothetical protein
LIPESLIFFIFNFIIQDGFLKVFESSHEVFVVPLHSDQGGLEAVKFRNQLIQDLQEA